MCAEMGPLPGAHRLPPPPRQVQLFGEPNLSRSRGPGARDGASRTGGRSVLGPSPPGGVTMAGGGGREGGGERKGERGRREEREGERRRERVRERVGVSQ